MSSCIWEVVLLLAVALVLLITACDGAFLASVAHQNTPSTCRLFMGKGFNKGNKQADLAKKMQLAKQKKDQKPDNTEEAVLSAQEIKERNDRLRFEELLSRESSNVLSNYAKDGYLSKEQEEEEITAARSGIDRLFEGDNAPLDPLEDLLIPQSGNALGKAGADRLLANDFLVILTDPRAKSSELRLTIPSLTSLPKDLLAKLIVVNADSPAENRRWMKKSGVHSVNIYCDENMDLMRAYTALGEKRWAMCLFVVGQGRIQKLAREVDPMVASRVIQNAVKSLNI